VEKFINIHGGKNLVAVISTKVRRPKTKTRKVPFVKPDRNKPTLFKRAA
jgi:hypothetical protein